MPPRIFSCQSSQNANIDLLQHPRRKYLPCHVSFERYPRLRRLYGTLRLKRRLCTPSHPSYRQTVRPSDRERVLTCFPGDVTTSCHVSLLFANQTVQIVSSSCIPSVAKAALRVGADRYSCPHRTHICAPSLNDLPSIHHPDPKIQFR